MDGDPMEISEKHEPSAGEKSAKEEKKIPQEGKGSLQAHTQGIRQPRVPQKKIQPIPQEPPRLGKKAFFPMEKS